MTLSNTRGLIKKFGRTSWRFQTTFGTPLKDLDSFVSAILADDGEFAKGTVTIDGYVFEPNNLKRLLVAKFRSDEFGHDWTISADGKKGVRELLKAALSDWVDFLFIPMLKPFVIYADHDEHTTFYANTKSNLNRVTQPLLKNGFQQIPDFQREF